MKKNIFLLAVAFFVTGTTLFAQDTIQALTIDSTLVVGDSAIVGSSLRVEGETTMRQNATAARDFTVDGNAIFNGSIFYPNVPAYSEYLSDKDFLVIDPISGLIEKSTAMEMQDQFYTKYCYQVNGVIENPAWSNKPNTIYVDCPNINVGIGTDEPAEKLHVAGNELIQGTLKTGNIGLGTDPSTFSRMKIQSTTYGAGLEVNSVGNNYEFSKLLFLQYDNPSTEIIKVVNTETGHIPFFLEASGRMTIHNGTRKIFQLDTTGVLHTRTVKVNTYNWPDYVFTPSYDLRPLSEVRKFINSNGHLPEVPSAQETETGGVDVAEMDKILLKKIEELTLYILEQEERIKALEAAKP